MNRSIEYHCPCGAITLLTEDEVTTGACGICDEPTSAVASPSGDRVNIFRGWMVYTAVRSAYEAERAAS
jgi:hypothetical protein